MNGDIRRLLGGYATGSLTDAERKELYEAALQDPQLFEALADEDVLRELLEDSTARAEVLRAAESPRFTLRGALAEWLSRPKGKVLGSLLAVLVVAVCVQALMDVRTHSKFTEREPNLVAQAPRILDESDAVDPGSLADAPAALPESSAHQSTAPRAKARAVVSSTAPPPSLATPPTANADQPEQPELTQTAVAGDLQLRYTMLLQRSDVEPQPVPPQHRFAEDDQVVIRFETSQSGWLLVQNPNGANLQVTQIGPDKPMLYPVVPTPQAADDTSRIIEVMFSRRTPTLTQPRPFRALSDTAARFKVPETAQGTSVVASPSTPPETLALRIVVERKKD